jgi:uncharacterized membrane protein
VTPRFRIIDGWLRHHSSLLNGVALASLTVSAAVLRAYRLGAKSLWYDEAVLYWVARTPVPSLITANAEGNSAPPLYPLLVHSVSETFTNEAALRSLSWLAGVLAIPVFFQLALAYVSKRAAFGSAVLIAIAPVLVEYSQQLREYSMAFLVSALMLLSFRRFTERNSLRDLAFVVASFSAAVFLQYGLALLIVSLNCAFIVEVLWLRRQKGQAVRWVAGQAVVLMAAAFVWASTLRFQFSYGGFHYLSRGYFEGPATSMLSFLFRQTYEIVLFAFPDPPLLILLIGTGIIAAIVDGGSARKYSHLALPLLVAAAGGIMRLYPYVGARQSIYLLPVIYILFAMGLEYLLRVDKRVIVAAVLGILIARAALLPTLAYLGSQGDENLKPLVLQLNADLEPQDRIFVCHGAVPAFRYYYRGDPDKVVEGAPSELWQGQFSSLLRSSDRVWFVASHCGDISPYVEFANERRPIREVASAAHAWLFLSE